MQNVESCTETKEERPDNEEKEYTRNRQKQNSHGGTIPPRILGKETCSSLISLHVARRRSVRSLKTLSSSIRRSLEGGTRRRVVRKRKRCESGTGLRACPEVCHRLEPSSDFRPPRPSTSAKPLLPPTRPRYLSFHGFTAPIHPFNPSGPFTPALNNLHHPSLTPLSRPACPPNPSSAPACSAPTSRPPKPSKRKVAPTAKRSSRCAGLPNGCWSARAGLLTGLVRWWIRGILGSCVPLHLSSALRWDERC